MKCIRIELEKYGVITGDKDFLSFLAKACELAGVELESYGYEDSSEAYRIAEEMKRELVKIKLRGE